MPIFGSKDKAGNLSCNFMHADGISDFQKGIAINVTQEDSESRLSIVMRIQKKTKTYLSYSQICAVEVISAKEIAEKSKSVVGRAAVGGLLLGPLGAVVGGMSGIGGKNQNLTKFYFVINYHPTNSPDETKVVSFEIVGASLHWKKFYNALKTKCNIQPAKVGGYI